MSESHPLGLFESPVSQSEAETLPVASVGVREQGRTCNICCKWLRSKQLPASLSLTLQLAFSLKWNSYEGLLKL